MPTIEIGIATEADSALDMALIGTASESDAALGFAAFKPTAFAFPAQSAFNAWAILGPHWQLYFFDKGTAAEATVYSDDALLIPHSFPVVLDRFGNLPTIYINAEQEYTISVRDEHGIERHIIDTDSPEFGTAAYADLIDDDTFASASDDTVPSSASVKNYVDNNSGGIGQIAWTPNLITSNVTIPDNHGALSIGKETTVDDGVTVTVGENSTWVVGVE